jgi:hypothetical protein
LAATPDSRIGGNKVYDTTDGSDLGLVFDTMTNGMETTVQVQLLVCSNLFVPFLGGGVAVAFFLHSAKSNTN